MTYHDTECDRHDVIVNRTVFVRKGGGSPEIVLRELECDSEALREGVNCHSLTGLRRGARTEEGGGEVGTSGVCVGRRGGDGVLLRRKPEQDLERDVLVPCCDHPCL